MHTEHSVMAWLFLLPPKLMLKVIYRDVECPGHTGHKGSSLLDKLNPL